MEAEVLQWKFHMDAAEGVSQQWLKLWVGYIRPSLFPEEPGKC